LHSYYFLPDSPEHVLAEAEYGERFTSAVCKEHVIGVQFHPEKSHHWGIQLLQNFAESQI
jgi:glutamine amidotransferase